MADNANWYVVHTYSGYENTVKATIEKYVENRHLQDMIHEISIPLETVTEITDNGPKDDHTHVVLGTLVKLLGKGGDVHAVLAQSGTNRGGGSRLAGGNLLFYISSYFLCHE